MSDEAKMAGKRVLVTGADTGIGRGVALEFARDGAAVALHYPREADGARSAVAEIRAAGGRAEAFQADFNDMAAGARRCRRRPLLSWAAWTCWSTTPASP